MDSIFTAEGQETIRSLIVFVLVGLLVLWVIGMMGENVMSKLRPIVPVLLIAGVIGFALMQAL